MPSAIQMGGLYSPGQAHSHNARHDTSPYGFSGHEAQWSVFVGGNSLHVVTAYGQ